MRSSSHAIDLADNGTTGRRGGVVRKASLYSLHPSVAMVQKFIAGLAKNTGRSLDEWVDLVRHSPVRGVPHRTAWLQAHHDLGRGTASLIAERAEPLPRTNFAFADEEHYLAEAEEFVAAMYAGRKAHLRPIYDSLLRRALALGNDVRACPCQTIVPLYRRHVFAQIKPTTLTRIDLGLSLRGIPFDDRLRDTGGSARKDRITHRIELKEVAEIDGEVLAWMRRAYELTA